MQKILTSLAGVLASALMLVAVAATPAAAEPQAAKSPLGSPLGMPMPAQQAAPSAAPAASPPTAAVAAPEAAPAPATGPGAVTQIWNWILAAQSALNRDMAASIKGMKRDNPLSAALTLIGIAFAYGVLHAAGPGHGKSVISAYVLTNRETVRRGIALSFLSALFQALSAILFVGILAIVMQQTSLQMRSTEATVETISWGLVAAVGAFLLWRQIAPLIAHRDHDDHGHGGHNHNHDHHHEHGPDCACGHSHMAAPEDLQGEWSWRKALPLALSVGIRPCSGAILLLIFAMSQGMLWAGIAGTFAMALGTAITVSILATLAVSSREWAARASGPDSVWAERIQTAAGFAGAGLVFVLGTAFFIASLKGPGPL
jgi:nickel/cobalt exporter